MRKFAADPRIHAYTAALLPATTATQHPVDHPRKIICTSKNLRQAVPIFGAKLWNEIPGRMRDMSKKVFKRKLISVLFGILKDNDDNLDATMITREIKSRNPEP